MILHKRIIDISEIAPYPRPFIKQDLLEDIRKNGLKKRVWLKETDGKYYIRDGRHRIDCCIKLGITKIPALISKKDGT